MLTVVASRLLVAALRNKVRRLLSETDLMKKWKLLHARTPEDMPQSVLADLAGKIPLEDKWQQVGTNDAPLMAFTTEWSKRYFDNKELSEAACGLGTKSRFVYTQEPSASGFLVVTRFEHQPATRMCERKSNQEQPELTRLQKPAEIPADKVAPTPPKPIALPPDKLKIFEAFKQQLRSGKDAVPEKALEQLKPVRFETNRKNPKCPEIDSTISDCQAECSLGASYSFSVRQNGGDCEVKAEKQKCIGLSECKNLSQKWKMLRQQPPASMPASHVEDLARLLPNSIPMRARRRPGNLCAVFNTQLSGRYALDGSPLSTDCGEGYRRYAAGGFLSDGKCFFSFGLVEESSICAVNDDEFDDGMLRKHNEIRGKYGVPLLKFDPRLKKFAEYWADRLNEEHECELYHSTPSIHRALVEGFENVGENLAVQCVGGNLRWQKVVQDWFSEILCYRYGKVGNACTADKLPKCDNKFHDEGVMVGHMTQMMADLSTHVGCAYRICQSSCRTASSPTRKFLIVCNYGPAGNIVGTHPFSKTVAEKLQRQLPGAALLPEAEEDDASQKKCQERHRQFKRQKPKEKL
ncbi:SCP family extracellular subfamily protein [Besnoitia besnoiti]|uniref:SCP family extracellular subfamily protein n=1 Tax=Besnoitia besnoiti TaxID=94643 RepID=A0A2A9MQY8_BESBE|nr:SCP family extracellular subfamily protein [Besnoitia besnoiti]PFH38650.1 SCP family extracellular subfamily protein [Besnoitia besnoiti]